MTRPGDDVSSAVVESRAQPVYLTLTTAADAGVDLPTLWNALLRGKWQVVIIAAIFAVAATVYSLTTTPTYRAEVVLAPATESRSSGNLSRLGGLASLAGLNLLGTTGDSIESVAMLESRKFIEEFIRDEKLLPVLFAEDWDLETRRWKSSDPQDQPDIRDAVDRFVNDIRIISEDSQTGLVTFAIEWRNAEQAAEWATKLVSRINESIRRRDVEDSQKKLDYLNQQLNSAMLFELREAIARVIEEQINAMMLAQSQTEYAFKVIDPAWVPKRRIRPKRTLIVIVATFLGGVIGVSIVLLQVLARPRSAEIADSNGQVA